MSNRNYYCLVAGLPDLIPDDKKMYFSSVTVRDYLREELHPSDFSLVELFYLPFDHINLMNLLYNQDKEWDERGNYSQEQMEQLADKKQMELIDSKLFPSYIVNFMKLFHENDENRSKSDVINILTREWYNLLKSSGNKFVVDFASYKQNIGNILLALNGRKYKIPFENLIVGDNEVTGALKKSRSRDFGLSSEINDIEHIVQIFEMENILDREMKLDNYTWQYIDEITFFKYFSIEKILGFVQKLFIVERWYKLDRDKGQKVFSQLLQELQSNFEFPEEFAITYGKRK